MDDHNYQSDRYDAWGGDAGLRQYYDLRRYRQGDRIGCYVNPADPRQAILSRVWRLGLVVVALFPLALGLAGLAGIAITLRILWAMAEKALTPSA